MGGRSGAIPGLFRVGEGLSVFSAMPDQPYRRRVAARIFGQPKLYLIAGIASIALAQNPKGMPFVWYIVGVAFLTVAGCRLMKN